MTTPTKLTHAQSVPSERGLVLKPVASLFDEVSHSDDLITVHEQQVEELDAEMG
jgi:hypothetical protein